MPNYDDAVKAVEEIIKKPNNTKEIEKIKALIKKFEKRNFIR